MTSMNVCHSLPSGLEGLSGRCNDTTPDVSTTRHVLSDWDLHVKGLYQLENVQCKPKDTAT